MSLEPTLKDWKAMMLSLFEGAGPKEAKKYLESCPKPLTLSALNSFKKPIKPRDQGEEMV